MGRQEDAVEGFCILRAWAIQGVFLGHLGSCRSSQESPELLLRPVTAPGSIPPLLSLAPCELIYSLASTTASGNEFLHLAICCEKCRPLLDLLLDHFSGCLLVLKLYKVTFSLPLFISRSLMVFQTAVITSLSHSFSSLEA